MFWGCLAGSFDFGVGFGTSGKFDYPACLEIKMTTLSPSDLLARLHWRYATKRFDPARRISTENWQALEQALVLAPSSFGLQPWKFIVVTDPVKKAALVPHSWNQTQPAECSHLVVFAVKTGVDAAFVERYIDRIVAVRGVTKESLAGFRGFMLGSIDKARTAGSLDTWQTHQIYIALGQFMTAAALMGIDTCPMEGIVAEQYDRELGLSGSGYQTVVACAAGYRAEDDKYAKLPKVRFSSTDVITHI